MHITSLLRRALSAFVLVAVVTFGAIAAEAAEDPGTTTANGITRAELGEAQPVNAPGQELYLQRVTIAPGAKLAEHFHQGTQVARIASGVLTYEVMSGQALVTRANGTSETVTGPTTVKLRRGDGVVETQGMVHQGSNAGKRPVVIELTALLQQGAPLATPVGSSTTGTALSLTADLESQSRTLRTVGGDDTTFTATLGVLGGTGRYADATGTGIFTGSRQAALGTTVAATFALTISG